MRNFAGLSETSALRASEILKGNMVPVFTCVPKFSRNCDLSSYSGARSARNFEPVRAELFVAQGVSPGIGTIKESEPRQPAG